MLSYGGNMNCLAVNALRSANSSYSDSAQISVMTDEERIRMKWLCLLIHEEKDYLVLDRLVNELEELLAATRHTLSPLVPHARPH